MTGKYVLTYSRAPGYFENITFLESFDLVHWGPRPLDQVFNIDQRFYRDPGECGCEVRLRTICQKDPTFYDAPGMIQLSAIIPSCGLSSPEMAAAFISSSDNII